MSQQSGSSGRLLFAYLCLCILTIRFEDAPHNKGRVSAAGDLHLFDSAILSLDTPHLLPPIFHLYNCHGHVAVMAEQKPAR